MEQKIQGVIDHGREKFTMYRTFHTVAGNSNLNIHTFLLQLEDWRESNDGRYPTKIYWQIDGGSENANKYVLAICEYLIAQTPIEEIYLTRLPVGHTHEDIDARFGTIWDHVRLLTINTPNDYKEQLRASFPQSDDDHCNVVDIFWVPDYKSFFRPSIDPKLKYYSKLDETKLQWRFEKTNEPRFPLGVKTTYRAFAQDSVILIYERCDIPMEKLSYTGSNTGLQAVEARIHWEPRNEETGVLDGQYQLFDRPTNHLLPQGLVKGSRANLEKIINAVKLYFNKNLDPKSQSPHVDSWNAWVSSNCPVNNSVVDFLEGKELEIPLAHIFNLSLENETSTSVESSIELIASKKRGRPRHEVLLQIESTASVQTCTHLRKAPYVWVDTGLPVGRTAADQGSSDLLMERNYELMSNADIKKYLFDLNDKYNIHSKINAPNKKTLVELAKKAVVLARNAANLLQQRDFSAMSNGDLKKLLVAIKGKYKIETKVVGKDKQELLDLINNAIVLARDVAIDQEII